MLAFQCFTFFPLLKHLGEKPRLLMTAKETRLEHKRQISLRGTRRNCLKFYERNSKENELYPRLNLIELDLKLTFHTSDFSMSNLQDVKLAKPEFAVMTVS